jgi:hypothetical protein
MEPGNKDCQPRPELCEELLLSAPPICMGASSEVLLDEDERAWEDESLELLGPRGILKVSPLAEEDS